MTSTKKKILPSLIQLFALGSLGSATPPKKKEMVATTEATMSDTGDIAIGGPGSIRKLFLRIYHFFFLIN